MLAERQESEGILMSRKDGAGTLAAGGLLIVIFGIWTALIKTVDVRPLGQNGTDIGFAAFNCWFHRLTGIHMTVYHITDWLGLVAIFVGLMFAAVGLSQLVKRRSLFRVDKDILILGLYYLVVLLAYVVFEMVPINYRPVLIDGRLEPSYPSSTTLLILCVMPTLVEQVDRRVRRQSVKKAVRIATALFSVCMVIGRLASGVHWLTDIAGAVPLSLGLFKIYKGSVMLCEK